MMKSEEVGTISFRRCVVKWELGTLKIGQVRGINPFVRVFGDDQ